MPRAGLPVVAAALCLVAEPSARADNTIFLQFDEQQLVAGDEDHAPSGTSWTLQWFDEQSATIPAFDPEGTEDPELLIAAVLQLLDAQWEGIDVQFVTERPTEGDYRMVTMGGWGGVLGLPGAGGWGTLDCYDDNKTSIAFVFSEALRDFDGNHVADTLAQVISQEVAHTVGLEHLGDNSQFIMYPSTSNQTGHFFSETCEAITGAITDPEHPEYCAQHPGCEPGYQNDIAHLLEFLGPAEPPMGGTEGGDDSGTGSEGGDETGMGSDDGGSVGETTTDMPDSSTTAPSATDGTGDVGATGGDEAMNDGEPEGCGCTTDATPRGAVLWGLPLLALGLRRRRGQ
ncbi:MAG: MYXO-CTERM sorting domain-containing protein [Myxococcota bacterium]